MSTAAAGRPLVYLGMAPCTTHAVVYWQQHLQVRRLQMACSFSLPISCAFCAPQVIALQASENPAMMAVVSQLQHAVLTMPWEVRIAAAQAIAKVHSLLFLKRPAVHASEQRATNESHPASTTHIATSEKQQGWAFLAR